MSEQSQARGVSTPRHLPEPEDTELNMTPMIDIVFQLIIFFLLSLKFKTVDHRIDAMLPHGEGIDISPRIKDEEPRIKIKVFRRELGDPLRAYTLLKVANSRQFRLPAGWRGRRVEEQHPDRLHEYDAVVAALQQEIHRRLALYGGSIEDVHGEIAAPLPRGGAVPHGDVTAVLNAFLREGVTNVKFIGSPSPLTRTERAARNARDR